MIANPDIAALYTFFGVMSFVFGIFFGSFFNVCIYRVPIKKSIVLPPSHCYHCGSYLSWYDNIPLLSYLVLRGNCRSCGTHFSSRYFFVELLSGLIFLAIFIKHGIVLALPFHFAFAGLLIVGTFTDIDHYILPDGITIGGFVFALIATAIMGKSSIVASEFILAQDIWRSFDMESIRMSAKTIPYWIVIGWSLAGAAFGYSMLAGVGVLGKILFRKEGMGGGDLKLFLFLGAYLGPLNCFWILMISAILGSCVGLTLILTHQLLNKDEFEQFELAPDAAVGKAIVGNSAESGTRDNLVIAESVASPADDIAAAEGGETPSSISLSIARRTARQMHHFPYGPYIAVAALLVLLFNREINVLTREYLFLPPAQLESSSLLPLEPMPSR